LLSYAMEPSSAQTLAIQDYWQIAPGA